MSINKRIKVLFCPRGDKGNAERSINKRVKMSFCPRWDKGSTEKLVNKRVRVFFVPIGTKGMRKGLGINALGISREIGEGEVVGEGLR